MHLELDQSLDLRIAEFRSDPEKMKCVNDFIEELVEKAQKDAEIRRNNSKHKHKSVCKIFAQFWCLSPDCSVLIV